MGKIAWLTGASTGIGRAVALRLAADGWQVAASARDRDKLSILAADAEQSLGTITPYPLDVTDRDGCLACVARIERELGPIDLVILNAGTHEPSSVDRFSSALVRRLLEVNVMGVVHGLEAALPIFLARRAGRVMIVASLAGYRGLPSAAAYGASKAALINMAEALRPELAAKGVVLQLVNPGFVKTPLTDRNDFTMPFLVSAETAADCILGGLKSDRFEIAFPRRFAWLMKVLRVLPYWLYLPLTRRMVR